MCAERIMNCITTPCVCLLLLSHCGISVQIKKIKKIILHLHVFTKHAYITHTQIFQNDSWTMLNFLLI